jgi:hypothetical protein
LGTWVTNYESVVVEDYFAYFYRSSRLSFCSVASVEFMLCTRTSLTSTGEALRAMAYLGLEVVVRVKDWEGSVVYFMFIGRVSLLGLTIFLWFYGYGPKLVN